MKILLYTPTFLPKVDGLSLRVQHHLKSLDELFPSIDVVVICPDFLNQVSNTSLPDVASHQETFGRFRIIRLPSFKPMHSVAPDTFLANPFAIIHLMVIIREFKPDILHFVGPDFLWLSFILIKHVLGITNIPYFASYHQHCLEWVELQPISWIEKKAIRGLFGLEQTLRLSDYLISPSYQIQKYLNNYRRIPCSDVWPLAVQGDLFDGLNLPETDANHPLSLDALRKEFTFNSPDYENVPILMYAGRMAHEKNLDWLLEMMQRFNDSKLKVFMVFIGSGAMDDILRIKHGEKTRIFFSDGFWSQEKLAWSYAACDFFMMPSSFETLGNVCLEAMGCGSLVIGRYRGGVPDIVHDGRNGCIISPDTNEGLFECTKDWLRRWQICRDSHPGTYHSFKHSILEKPSLRKDDYAEIVYNAYQFAHNPAKTWDGSCKVVVSMYKKTLLKQKSKIESKIFAYRYIILTILIYIIFYHLLK